MTGVPSLPQEGMPAIANRGNGNRREPIMTNTVRFTQDGYSRSYDAVSYGPLWNGWLTPVVTRETLEGVLGEYAEWNAVAFAADGTAVITFTDYPTEPLLIGPDAEGNYNLAALGYTFYAADESKGVK